MSGAAKKKKWFENVKMPHTYVILITILVIMTILTQYYPGRTVSEGGGSGQRDNGCGAGQL